MDSTWNRRAFLSAALAAAALPSARAQVAPGANVSPEATPRDWSGQTPLRYPDPDIVALDPRFQRYIVFNTPIQRLHIGTLWAEGPAWNGVGRYLVWSDIPNNVQMRWIDDDARVTTFRNPSGNSNGNTFDLRGPAAVLRARRPARRALRAERHRHDHRRQVRGQAAELAERRRRASGRQHLVHRSVLRHPRQLRGLQGGVGDEGSRVPRGRRSRAASRW